MLDADRLRLCRTHDRQWTGAADGCPDCALAQRDYVLGKLSGSKYHFAPTVTLRREIDRLKKEFAALRAERQAFEAAWPGREIWRERYPRTAIAQLTTVATAMSAVFEQGRGRNIDRANQRLLQRLSEDTNG